MTSFIIRLVKASFLCLIFNAHLVGAQTQSYKSLMKQLREAARINLKCSNSELADLKLKLGKPSSYIAFNKHCFSIKPYLDLNYIPQGLHVTSTNNAYITMYHKPAGGESNEQPAIIVKINKSSGGHRFFFVDKEKYGGIGVYANETKFAVPNSNQICTFKTNNGGSVNLAPKSCKTMNMGDQGRTTQFSFLTVHRMPNNKQYAFVGQFEYQCSGAGCKSYGDISNGMHVFGYEILKNGIKEKASYRFYIPPEIPKVQGVAIVAEDTKGPISLLLSTSLGSKPSELYKINYDYHEPYIYKYKYRDYQRLLSNWELPPGLEEIHLTTKNNLWVLGESGAKEYLRWQKSAKKDVSVPYIYRIPSAELGL